jgi:hypothetical protein
MVISADEKKILLERLQKARETKAAKAKAKAKEPEPPAPAPVPEPPAPVPVPVPEPVPEPIKPAPSEPIDIPAVPDLVAMSKKKPAKKKKVESSDESDSEAELPPKKGKGGKKQAYMKIKIYKEPKNAAAFQSLVEAIQDEQPEPEPAPEPIPQAAASIGRGCKFDIKNKTPAQSRTLPTPQELMRRAALEFFG